MKSISVSVSDPDYEAFRTAAKVGDRSIAELIREAMAYYRVKRLAGQGRLEHLTVLSKTRPKGALPSRVEIYGEITARHKI